MKKIVYLLIIGLFIVFIINCKTTKSITLGDQRHVLITNAVGKGIAIEIDFIKGKAHNHPLFAIWIEDTSGKYIQTLYVAQSIAKGVFQHGDVSTGAWLPGAVRRPAALPFWAHKRDIKAQDGLMIPDSTTLVPDAYTGATPQSDFVLHTHSDDSLPQFFNVLFEINQTWDWNEYWTNNKFPRDMDYKTSCQPALVYMGRINLNSDKKDVELQIIGHSHPSGKDGILTADISTLTTALNIVGKIRVIIK